MVSIYSKKYPAQIYYYYTMTGNVAEVYNIPEAWSESCQTS